MGTPVGDERRSPRRWREVFPGVLISMWTELRLDWVGSRNSVLGLALLVVATGCHSRTRNQAAEMSRKDAVSPAKLAEDGRATIVAICEKESFATARSGLIVSESGLREDVFLLRDRGSYQPVPYGLDEAMRLVALLDTEAGVASRSELQTTCIREFAEHLESLTEPLTEAARREHEIDTSAFTQSDKQVQDELERESNAKVPHE
jgi:hypothetical protein